jgi:chromosome segregation ATPase
MPEPTLAEVLQAVADLGARMERRFEGIDRRFEAIDRRFDTVEATQREHSTQLAVIDTRLDGFEKRLDDQGRILAALIPTRIAAIPPAA